MRRPGRSGLDARRDRRQSVSCGTRSPWPTAIPGTDCLLWGNDYPHREGSFPESQEWVEKQFDGVPEPEIEAMTWGNASKLFGLTVE